MAFDKDYQELDLTWERGLVESVEDSMLPVGASARLRNWFADPSGNLRTRVGWLKGSTTGAPSTRIGAGVGHYATQRRPRILQEAVSNGTTATLVNVRTPTWSVPTTAGSLLVACMSFGANGSAEFGNTTVITPPDADWVLAKKSATLGGGVEQVYSIAAIYYKENAASESGAKNWTFTSSGGVVRSCAVSVYEVINVPSSGTLDRVGQYRNNPGDSTASSISLSAWSGISGATASASTDVITTQVAHGFSVGDTVRVATFINGTIPPPLAEGTTYYVKTVPTSTTFTLSLTLNGDILNITGTGSANSWAIGKYPRDVPVGIAFAVVSQQDGTDNSITSSSGYTLQDEAAPTGGGAFTNHYVYSKVYEGAAASPDLDATTSSGGPGINGVLANFKADNYFIADGFYVEAVDQSPSTAIYTKDATDLASGTHTLLDTIVAPIDVNPVAFASGNLFLFYSHPSFQGVRTWDGGLPAWIADSPAGRCLAWHKNRLFAGGTLNEPWKLFFSEFGDHTVWNAGSATFIEVGKGDGEAIEDICPFQDGLMIVKRTSAWFLTGGSPDTFRLIRLPLGGAAPGRSLAATPDGVVIAGTRNVYLFDGGSVGVISSPVRESYRITGDWVSTDYVDQKISICDQGTGNIWTMDFSNGGTWYEERVSDIDEAPAFLCGFDDTQVYQPVDGQISFLNYRTFPASPYAKDYDALEETFEAWTPEIWPVGPEKKVTPRYLFVKTRQRGGDATETPLSVLCYYNGTLAATKTITPRSTPSVFWTRLDIGSDTYGKSVSQVQFRFTQTLDDGETACFDIEEVTFGFNVEEVV